MCQETRFFVGIYMYIYIYTHTQTHTHTYTLKQQQYIETRANTYMQHAYMPIHIITNTHYLECPNCDCASHSCANAVMCQSHDHLRDLHVYVSRYVCMHSSIFCASDRRCAQDIMHAYIHTHTHTYTHIHTYTYTHIHTHTYIHTYTYSNLIRSKRVGVQSHHVGEDSKRASHTVLCWKHMSVPKTSIQTDMHTHIPCSPV
jgi:hypothetical protein